MYLTFYKQGAENQYSFEDLINNPYAYFDVNTKDIVKRVTTVITPEYGERLYYKRYLGLFLPDMTVYDDMDVDKEYTHFTIPKKSNPHKRRHIDAPSDRLKAAQTIYKTFIEDTLKVINHKAAHAYTKERSIVTANETHVKNKSKWFLKMDLSDFFNSIDEDFLRKMLLEVYPFKYIPEEHLNRIVKLSLYNGVLPQGSVLSPTLTNIIMIPIDYMITETLHNYNKHHYVYTRYADDITISSKEKFDWREIKDVVQSIFDKWKVPFSINNEKTRFTSINGKNYHCGININYNKRTNESKLSLGHEKNNKFKAMIHNFCIAGEAWERKDIYKMLGLISYYKSVEPAFVEKIINKYQEKHNLNIKEKANYLLNA